VQAVVGGSTVAAKRLKDWKVTAGGSLAHERGWLLAIDHPNVIPYKGCVFGPQHQLLFVLTEFMGNGRLSDACSAGPICARAAVRYGIDIALGLTALHTRTPPVMHRDLHSDNILIADDGRAVVADLGSAKEVVAGAYHPESIIHYSYIKPPEVRTKVAGLGAR
jgi:serine/threonine protein kinase